MRYLWLKRRKEKEKKIKKFKKSRKIKKSRKKSRTKSRKKTRKSKTRKKSKRKNKKIRKINFKAPTQSKDSEGNSVIKVSDSWANHAYVNESKYKKKYKLSIKEK